MQMNLEYLDLFYLNGHMYTNVLVCIKLVNWIKSRIETHKATEIRHGNTHSYIYISYTYGRSMISTNPIIYYALK